MRVSAAERLEANAREQDPKLSLAKCQLTAVPLDVLRLTHELEALDLSANKLKHFCFSEEEGLACADGPEDQSEPLPPVETRLRKMAAGVKELNLSLNKLQSEMEAFAQLRIWTGLNRLDLSGNGLKRLPPGFWDVLANGLTELKLSYNCLSELPQPLRANNYGEQPTLPPSAITSLHVNCNNLKTIPDMLPRHCPSLTHLFGSDNALKTLPASFAAFSQLRHLDLSGNRIATLPTTDEFYDNLAGTLVYLGLKDNMLTTLPQMLSRLTSLEVLDLRKNRIDSITGPESLDIPSLRVLDLSCNRLTHLELSERLTQLDTLRVEHNRLRSLPSAIHHFQSLLRLYAHDNKLERLPDGITQLTQIQELDIGRNLLIDVPKELDDLKRQPTMHYYRKSLPDEVISGLYIGGADSAANLESLRHRNVKLIVQLVVESEEHFPEHFDYLTYKIADHPTSDLSRYFATCNKRIAEALEEGNGALVHCVAGISRSATIVIAFLMNHLKISCDRAIDMLRQARPAICPNPGFLAQLKEYEQLICSP